MTSLTMAVVAVECFKCGKMFGMPESVDRANRKYKDAEHSWYCPFCGESQQYAGETTEARLKRELAEANARARGWMNRVTEEKQAHNRTQHRLRAQKGVATRIKKRIAAGLCPYCKRNFQNLKRHIDTKHPGCAHKATKKK